MISPMFTNAKQKGLGLLLGVNSMMLANNRERISMVRSLVLIFIKANVSPTIKCMNDIREREWVISKWGKTDIKEFRAKIDGSVSCARNILRDML